MKYNNSDIYFVNNYNGHKGFSYLSRAKIYEAIYNAAPKMAGVKSPVKVLHLASVGVTDNNEIFGYEVEIVDRLTIEGLNKIRRDVDVIADFIAGEGWYVITDLNEDENAIVNYVRIHRYDDRVADMILNEEPKTR